MGMIRSSACVNRYEGTFLASPPVATDCQPCIARPVPADQHCVGSLSPIDSSGPPATAEVKVLGTLFPQPLPGP